LREFFRPRRRAPRFVVDIRQQRLAASGRRQLEVETGTWARLTAAIGRVLEMA
jgi:hypothetical protein